MIGVATGGAYGVVGYLCGMPVQDSLIASGLLAAASVAPDVDTDSVPLKELASFLGACAGVVVTLCVQSYKYPVENAALIGIATYLAVRYGIAEMFLHFAVHRGIFHSILMAAFLSEIGYMLFSGERFYQSAAIFFGYVLHLILDEIWGFRKETAGTALKLWGKNWIVNIGLMVVMVGMGVFIWMQ
ncbi:MAG: metal-dependent hydrolase [Proteobacteria bacterium]|nr:metal-dependent hydrolase [Pseudomonadota bacterium]